MTDRTRNDVFLVGIGGATCSGKTTLAKHLHRIIPNSTLLFQDDFAPPSEKVPIHPVHGFQDWDDPEGAIEWGRQRSAIRHLRTTGRIPSEHASHDHLNEQIPVPIDRELETEWRDKFTRLFDTTREKPNSVVIAEGFLMLYDQETVREMDSRFFVREDYATLKKRRHDRHGYHTAEGALWRDPPDYWDLCVWPAYLKAHEPFFVQGQVESGPIDRSKIERVQILEARDLTMNDMVKACLEEIYDRLSS